MADFTDYQPGFQGSETSRMDVIIYQHKDDPLISSPDGGGGIRMSGSKRFSKNPSLLSVNTSKIMGATSGTFAFQVKPSKETDSLFSQLIDDSWVDIISYRHDQPWHVMRGSIDEIRRTQNVSGSGATSTVFTVTGRDFSKVWELTPIWFSPYATNDVTTKGTMRKVLKGISEVQGTPAEAVEAYLKLFLEEISGASGPNWEMPEGMPGVVSDSFLASIMFRLHYYQDIPARTAFNPNFFSPQGTLWSMAQQFSDPTFVEFYADILPDGDPFSSWIAAGDSLTEKDTQMTVVVRDKPFPVIDPDIGGFTSTWKDLPLQVVPRQSIVSSDLGRSGLERFNSENKLLEDLG